MTIASMNYTQTFDSHEMAIAQVDHVDVFSMFYQPRSWRTGEERLLEAVLRTGIDEARLGARDAVNWINTVGTRYVFSFDACCEGLDLDPSAVRKVLNLAIAARKRSGARRLGSGVVNVDDELGKYDHPFVGQNHCKDCGARYHKAWKRAQLES